MSADPPSLIFYFDVVSAYSYLAFHVIRNTPAFSSVEISYRPLFLGGVMAATGNRPPLSIKNKSAYTLRDFARQARRFDVPLASTIPPGFPAPTLLAQRALCVIELQFPDIFLPAIEALFHAIWVEHRMVGEPGPLTEVLSRLLPREEAERVVKEAGQGPAKDRLKGYTEEALERGCFGVPYMVTKKGAEEEIWWGFDHIKAMAEFLEIKLEEDGAFRSML